jgi:K+ transporter
VPAGARTKAGSARTWRSPLWREKLVAWMMRNSQTAMEFFNLSANRVVELGIQVEI